MALVQARQVQEKLAQVYPDWQIELLPLTTVGDKHLSEPLATVGGKGLFLKELEYALLAGEADIAVHSLKDITVNLPDGLTLAAYCERTEVRDAWVCTQKISFEHLPKHAVIGTASLRRACLVHSVRSELIVKSIRGNVHTRLLALGTSDYHGMILSAAGLERVGLSQCITDYLEIDPFLPAVGQGVVAIECRINDTELVEQLACLNDLDTMYCVLAERAFNCRLGRGCHVPIAGYAKKEGDQIHLQGLVGRVDGTRVLRESITGYYQSAEALGEQLADQLLAQGAGDILKEVYE